PPPLPSPYTTLFRSAAGASMTASPCAPTGGATTPGGGAIPGIDPVPTPNFNAGATGNIDADALLDIWTISSASRVYGAPTGNCTADANNPSGEPANDQNDVNL